MNRDPVSVLVVNHVSTFGGAERGMLDIVAALHDSPYRPVAALPGEGPLAQRLRARAVPVFHVPMLRFRQPLHPFRPIGYALHWAWTVPKLVDLLRAQQIGLLHANSANAHVYGGSAAKRAGIPAIWHCRDRPAPGLAGRWMGKHATRIAAVSQAIADRLTAPGSHANVRVLHNAVDTSEFQVRNRRTAMRRTLGIGPDALVIGMVAHFTPWKRHDWFLQAMAQVAQACAEARFLVVGADLFGLETRYEVRLQRLARECGLARRILFAGARSDMAAVYESIDLLAHPPPDEPFGRAVAEAMAMGRPVVATRCGGPGEIVEDNVSGLLVEPGPTALAEGVLRLIRDPALRQRLAEAAPARIRTRFSLDVYRARLLALYRECLESDAP